MGQALGLCCTLGETKALREEVAFFQAVKVILTKRDVTAQKKTDAQRDAARGITQLRDRGGAMTASHCGSGPPRLSVKRRAD